MSPLDVLSNADRTAQIILSLFTSAVFVAGGLVVSGLMLGGEEAIEPGDGGALAFIDENVVAESATSLPESPALVGDSDTVGIQELDQIASGSSLDSDPVASSATPTPRSTETVEQTIVTQPAVRQEPAPPSVAARPPSSEFIDVCDLNYQDDVDRFVAAYPDLIDTLTSSSELSFRFEGSNTILELRTPDSTSPVLVELKPLLEEVERLLPILDIEVADGDVFDSLHMVIERVNQCSGVTVDLAIDDALKPSEGP